MFFAGPRKRARCSRASPGNCGIRFARAGGRRIIHMLLQVLEHFAPIRFNETALPTPLSHGAGGAKSAPASGKQFANLGRTSPLIAFEPSVYRQTENKGLIGFVSQSALIPLRRGGFSAAPIPQEPNPLFQRWHEHRHPRCRTGISAAPRPREPPPLFHSLPTSPTPRATVRPKHER